MLKTVSQQTLVVLDIDSTLVQTHKRNEAILRQFAKDSSHSERFLFEQSECFPFEYGYSQALQRLGIDLNSPVAKEFAPYWRERFFSNDFLHHDILHDGAIDFVEWLVQKAIPHVYLTGRPHPLMWAGTLSTLKQKGFSVDETNLYLKPHPTDNDELFKSQKIKEFKKNHSTIWLIDNEPRVLNQIDRDHPDVHLIFVDTCHSPNTFPPAASHKIRDFRDCVQFLKTM